MPTLRQKIISLLIDEEMSAREISGDVGISEKEVYEHLSHIARSVASQDKKIVITPANCLACGFVFEDRSALPVPDAARNAKNPTSGARDSASIRVITDLAYFTAI